MDLYQLICNRLFLFEKKPAKNAIKRSCNVQNLVTGLNIENTFKYLKVPERVTMKVKKHWNFFAF